MTKRIFPMADWAPAQEAMYAGPSTSAGGFTMPEQQPAPGGSSAASEHRFRSMSVSLPWRGRPKSLVLGTGSAAEDDATGKLADLSLQSSRAQSMTSSVRHGHGHGYSQSTSDAAWGKAAGEQQGTLRGVIRRASISIKGMVHRRTSVVASSSSTIFEEPAGGPSSPRPGTSHSAWQRLRRATSLRRSRSMQAAELNMAATMRNDGNAPIPGIGGPPIIPRNTGAAAKAAAALQNEYLGLTASSSRPSLHQQPQGPHGHVGVLQNKWLAASGSGGSDDGSNDRESGIGITAASSECDLGGGHGVAGAVSTDDELDDDDIVLPIQHNTISRVDFVSRLPLELAIQILANLDAAALTTAARVSRRWRAAVRNQHIWRESFLREKTATYATSAPTRPGAGLGVPTVRPSNDWKQIYRVKEELDRRWREGKARPVYLNGHSDSIYCLQFDESKIITGSRDKTIRIWDMHTFECRLVIGPPEVINDVSLLFDENGEPVHYATTQDNQKTALSVPATASFPTHHKASILCLQYDDKILVTGSSDGSCIVHNVRSAYRPIRRLRRHCAAVLDLAFDDRHIVTCSKDMTICVWDRATGQLLRQPRGHTGPVNAVQMRGNTIVSCSGDFRVKLWNVDTGKNIRELAGHTKGLACSQFSEDGRYIASAGNDKVIRIWDANTGECLREMRAHENLVRSLHIDSVSGRLVSGSYDTDIKVFDMETGRQLLDFPKWHQSWVLSAKSDYRRIVSTGQDPKILIMDFGADVRGIEMLESGHGGEGSYI